MENNYIIDKKGKKTAVIVPLEEYDELMEDILDLAVVAERREESSLAFRIIQQNISILYNIYVCTILFGKTAAHLIYRIAQ